MTSCRRSLLACIILSISGFLGLLPRAAAAEPAHLLWAEELVDNITPALNEYEGSPHYITWAGVNGAVSYSNHTLCSGFLTILLKQGQGWTDDDIELWLGTKGPSAATYYSAITAEDGFDLVSTVDDIEAGDIIAIRYPEGSHTSGHVAIAEGPAVLRTATAPLVSGTLQFELAVIDSTQIGHGARDTRQNSDGTWQQGAGIGVMRLYTNSMLKVVGHTWSTASASSYRSKTRYSVAVGRLQ